MALHVDRVSKTILAKARRLREDFHRHPELAYRERRTASVIARVLREAGVDEVPTGIAETGVVGKIIGADREVSRPLSLRA